MAEMIEHVNNIAQGWAAWMWPMLWQVAVVVVVVWAVDVLIRRRVWPQVRYALWLLVLLKLVLPPSLSLPTSLTSELQPMAREVVRLRLPADEPVNRANPTIEQPIAGEGSISPLPYTPTAASTEIDSQPKVAPPANIVSTNSAAADAGAEAKLSFKAYLMFVWLVGVGVLAGWLALRLRQLRRISENCADSDQLPEWFSGVLADTAGRLKLRRLPKVVLSGDVVSPAVFGVFRPVLLMPAKDMGKLSRRDAEHILLHELAHIKRGDLKVHAFYMMLQIVYWFNPLLWVVRRQLQHLRELCCDATVAWILRERTADYRETLLETARRLLAKPVEPGMGLLGLFEDSNRLVTRLKWLEKKTWKYRPLRIAVVFAIVAIMFACILPMAKVAEKAPVGINETLNVSDASGQLTIRSIVMPPPKGKGILKMNSVKLSLEVTNSSEKDLYLGLEYYEYAGRVGIFYPGAHQGAYIHKVPKNWEGTIDFQIEYIRFVRGGNLQVKLAKCSVSELDYTEANIAFLPPNGTEIFFENKYVIIPRHKDKRTGQSDFTAALPNGVTVELVGVCEHPSAGKQWWRADGSLLGQSPAMNIDVGGYNIPRGEAAYELVAKLTGSETLLSRSCTPENWKVPQARKVGLGKSGTAKDRSGKSCLRATTAIVKNGLEKIDIEFGLAGVWKKRATISSNESSKQKIRDTGVVINPPYEKDSNATITIKIPNKIDSKMAINITAVLKNGKVIDSAVRSRNGKIRFVRSTDNYEFHGVKLSDVEHFEIYTSKYQWVEFKNVSLKPNFKTDVEVGANAVGETYWNWPRYRPTQPPTDPIFKNYSPQYLMPYVLGDKVKVLAAKDVDYSRRYGSRLACAWFIWKTRSRPKLREQLADAVFLKLYCVKSRHDNNYLAEFLGFLEMPDHLTALLEDTKIGDCCYGPALVQGLSTCGSIEYAPVLIRAFDKDSQGCIHPALMKITGVQSGVDKTKEAWTAWWKERYPGKKIEPPSNKYRQLLADDRIQMLHKLRQLLAAMRKYKRVTEDKQSDYPNFPLFLPTRLEELVGREYSPGKQITQKHLNSVHYLLPAKDTDFTYYDQPLMYDDSLRKSHDLIAVVYGEGRIDLIKPDELASIDTTGNISLRPSLETAVEVEGEEGWGDETNEENKSLWSEVKASLLQSEYRNFFGVDAAWLDKEHKKVVCILFGHDEVGISLYDYTNAYVAIAEKNAEGFICRQLIRLWDAKEDHSKVERLSLPMKHSRLSRKWRKFPKYARATILAFDIDADKDDDLLINLVGDGGSHNSAETFVLQNNSGTYSIIFSKSGAESQRFGAEAKRISRINDLDGDGISELMIWNELPAPEPHANQRDWLDIYHWDGSKISRCNSLFPQAYEQPKKGFLEVCERYPNQTPEFHYYLGLISEYQAQPKQATEYYNKSLKCVKIPEAYVNAAKSRLKALGETVEDKTLSNKAKPDMQVEGGGGGVVDGLSTRVIRFPNEPTRKRVFLIAETEDIKWWWGTFRDEDIIGEARGDMVVPADVEAGLSVRYGDALSLLEGLGPNDLHTLTVSGGAFDEGALRSIQRLTGLKRLVLMNPKIGVTELEKIKQIKHIERLCLVQNDLSDEAVEAISQMRWLKGLRIYSEEITNKSLEYVSRISGLEELFIAGPKLSDEGFEHITKMPALVELQLSKARDGMTVDVLKYLSKVPSLKKLVLSDFSNGPEVTEYISKIKRLESLRLDTIMTDEELAQLRQLDSLKDLHLSCEIQQAPKGLTDTGLEYLKEIKSLESLVFNYGVFTDKGLEYLSQLRNLKRLEIYDSLSLSEKRLGPLTRLAKLERLTLIGKNLSDSDIAVIVQIRGLKSLSLDSTLENLTDKSLASIGELKGLSHLSIWGDFTDEGLVHLEGLKSLRSLKIQTKRGLSRFAIERLEAALPNLKKVNCAKVIEDTPKKPDADVEDKETTGEEDRLLFFKAGREGQAFRIGVSPRARGSGPQFFFEPVAAENCQVSKIDSAVLVQVNFRSGKRYEKVAAAGCCADNLGL